MRCETWFLSLSFVVLAAFTGACDVQSECQSRFRTDSEVSACVDGANKGATLAGAFAGAGHGGAPGYVVMSGMCEDACKQDYTGKEKAACTQACQTRASILLSQPSN